MTLNPRDVECRSWDDAVNKAQSLSTEEVTYIPVDQGQYHSPRYQIAIAPKVGALVSKSFNGDSYPCGTITKVSSSYRRVETSTGEVFYRWQKSSSWKCDRTWFMIDGHHNERNPSF